MNKMTPPPFSRIHFIPEWMETHGLSRKDIMDQTGADKSLVSRWFKGSLPSDQYLARLATLFGIEREDLFRRPTSNGEASRTGPPATIAYGTTGRTGDFARDNGRQIPVYAITPGDLGHSLIALDPVEHHPAPPDLTNVRGAYGVLIRGDSMVPALRPGDIAWVNPHKLPHHDSDVVLYQMPPETNAEAEAIIKTLVSWTPQDWGLRQYHPPREWNVSKGEWPICHSIVGKKSAR
jgi:transcriptional regulator with XRE-family HTH domain